ncbi:GMC family oxidoreductase N-terminal domain-containing protein, partial [Acinetobacter baumannii]
KLPRTHDFNGAQFEGAGIYDLNTKNGERCSSSFAYLRPAESRSNLTVRSGTLVRRVQFEGKRAVGVVVAGPNGDEVIDASREVILAAGAV